MFSPWILISPSTRAPCDDVVHPVKTTQEGGLSAAGWADEGHHIAIRDIEVHAEERLFLAVEDGDIASGRFRGAYMRGIRRRKARS